MKMQNVASTFLARLGAIAAVALLSSLPLLAQADQPSYASGTNTETIKGTIYQVTGKYTLTVQDDRGFNDSVTIHDGTVITPTGLSLGSGQVATLTGRTSGKTFLADEIDVDPATVGYGQATLPGGGYTTEYAQGYNGNGDSYGYPGYAFGFGGGYGLDGFVGPYAPGYYGYNSGYYSGGNYYVSPPQNGGPGQSNPENPVSRRPVNLPPSGYAPPGFRYPTGGVRAPQPIGPSGARRIQPIVRGVPPSFRGNAPPAAPTVRMAPPRAMAAPPQMRSAPAAAAAPARAR